MTDSEITTTILRQIRDQLEKTNERLDRTIERSDHVKSANDAAIDDLRVRVLTLEKKVG